MASSSLSSTHHKVHHRVIRTKQLKPLSIASSRSQLGMSAPAASLWLAIRRLVKSGMLRSILMHSRARLESATFKQPKRTLLEVPSNKALKKTAYWQQGDASLYSVEQLEARFALRTSTPVQDALHLWWEAALWSMQSGGERDACSVCHDRYVSLFMSIYRQLVPGRVTSCTYQADARCSAEADWAHDTKGQACLERADFLDAIFELADHYVPTVDAGAYADFLRDLLQRVSIAHADEPPLLWREKPKPPGRLSVSQASAALPSPSKGQLPPPKTPPSPSKATMTPPRTPQRVKLAPSERLLTPPKRLRTPSSPLSAGHRSPSTNYSQRSLNPSWSKRSLESEWLASSISSSVLTPSASKSVLPAICTSPTATRHRMSKRSFDPILFP